MAKCKYCSARGKSPCQTEQDSARCPLAEWPGTAPPPELRRHRYHWLKRETAPYCLVAEWAHGGWVLFAEEASVSPRRMVERGWEYDEPLQREPERPDRCRTCWSKLSSDPGSLRLNCGGECMLCVADAGDPECLSSVATIARQMDERREAAEVARDRAGGGS